MFVIVGPGPLNLSFLGRMAAGCRCCGPGKVGGCSSSSLIIYLLRGSAQGDRGDAE
jgi:hypothetical protein